MMSVRFDRFRRFGTAGAIGAVIGVSLLTVSAALYLTPGSHREGAGATRTKTVVHEVWPSPRPIPTSVKTKRAWPKPIKSTVMDVVNVPSESSPRPITKNGSPTTAHARLPHCWDFRWQQDAQAAYLANLSDPGGLDGLAGPGNGDGLACNQLPLDPSRPESTPVDGIAAAVTSAPTKAHILDTPSTYYGVSSDALPGDESAFNQLDASVGKAPSLVEFFDTWDHPYAQDGSKVVESWAHGALPVMTWMPEPKGGTNSDLSAYTLDAINAGLWDDYLYTWAAQVAQSGYPMVIRFAHEMNGAWYPWSAGLSTITQSNGTVVTLDNTPAKYVQAWRHVWQVFQNVGANNDVIWAWTPVTTLCATHDVHVPGNCATNNYTTYAEDYPGDSYVDWTGLSSYAIGSASKFSFAGTFRASFTNLAAVSNKPVYVAETGAAQRVTTPGPTASTFATAVDQTELKVQWTTQVLKGFLDQGLARSDNFLEIGQRVIGFALFDNYVVDVHKVAHHSGSTIQRILTESDWRLNSSPAALAAFSAGVADPQYLGGTMPTVRPTVFADPNAVRWPVITTTTPPPTATPTPGAPVPTSPASGSSAAPTGTDATSTAPGSTGPTTSDPTSASPTGTNPPASASAPSSPSSVGPSMTASTNGTQQATWPVSD